MQWVGAKQDRDLQVNTAYTAVHKLQEPSIALLPVTVTALKRGTIVVTTCFWKSLIGEKFCRDHCFL